MVKTLAVGAAAALVATLAAMAAAGWWPSRPAETRNAAAVASDVDRVPWAALGSRAQLDAAFREWAATHGKRYATTEEYEARMGNFAASARAVFEHNSKLRADGPAARHWLGMTEYADLTDDEFVRRFGLDSKVLAEQCSAEHARQAKRRQAKRRQELGGDGDEAADRAVSAALAAAGVVRPESVDWRERGAVSPIRQQGHCGSCWAFSAVGALESAYRIKTGRSIELSQQELVDCSRPFHNMGCAGGFPSNAFEFAAENGLDRLRAYPYQAVDGACRATKLGVGVRPRGSVNISSFDEDALTSALGLVGPVSVAFQVTPEFRLYAGGVWTADCAKNVDSLNQCVGSNQAACAEGVTDAAALAPAARCSRSATASTWTGRPSTPAPTRGASAGASSASSASAAAPTSAASPTATRIRCCDSVWRGGDGLGQRSRLESRLSSPGSRVPALQSRRAALDLVARAALARSHKSARRASSLPPPSRSTMMSWMNPCR